MNDDEIKESDCATIALPSSLSDLFKLKHSNRQNAVDFIINWLLDIITNPTNKKTQSKSTKIIQKKLEDCQPALHLLSDIGFKSDAMEMRIQIKNENDPELIYLRNIYNILCYKNSERALVHRQSFDCKHLLTTHPPKFKDGRKKCVYRKIVPNGANDCFGALVYSRHRLMELTQTIADPTDSIQNQLIIKPKIYNYVSNSSDLSKLHFYVNFADLNLFGFYDGSLFAQDEIMTLEHPILCSLREKLKCSMNENKESKLIPNVRGAVVILNAIEHGHFTQKSLENILSFPMTTIRIELPM